MVPPMSRTSRFALVGAAALLVVVVGTAVASQLPRRDDALAAPASSHEPESEELDEEATVEDLAHAADRLAASEIAYDEAQLSDLAARYGIGGAVRVLMWADSTGLPVTDITALRDGTDLEPGMGWGQIAKELGVHPGIGSVMGNGHGREDAPGQTKDKDKDEPED